MSTEYLRDFINSHVGSECGGDSSSLVNPQTIQTQLNELKSRVDKIEGGIGFSATYSTSIFVTCLKDGDSFVAPIVTRATIDSLVLLADSASSTDGLAALKLEKTGETSTTIIQDLDPEKLVNILSIDLQVEDTDIITITVIPIPDSQNPAQAIYIGLLLKLPDKSLAIGQA